YSLEEAGKFCGVDPASIKAGLCTDAMTQRDLSFIGTNCPDQTKEIASKECGGLDTTSARGTEIGQFCAAYVADAMKDTAKQEPKPETKKDKTKKILKGIFP